MEISYEEKKIFQFLANFFDASEPDSFYWDYYELADSCDGSTPELWERFLDIPEIKRYKEVKLSKLWEFSAAKAMKMLEEKSGSTNPGAITALKEIIERSKMMQNQHKRNQTIVLTHVSKKDYEKEDE